MRIRGKTFLVTGGLGFIGSYTAKEILKKGGRVIVVDRASGKQKASFLPGAKLYKLELTSPKLEQVFKKEKPDYVFHFASGLLSPKGFDATADTQNILAAVNLLECACRFGVKKIIFASSGAVYGNSPLYPTPETQSADPQSPYALSKYVIEKYLDFYKKQCGLSYVILRYPNVYGPGQRTGALPGYVRELRAGSQSEIRGDGTMTRDFVYIDDVVRAHIAALDILDEFPDPIFNISTGRETSLNALYRAIAQILKTEAHPVYTLARPGEQIRYCLDPSKFEKLLGWKAKTSLKTGLKKVIAAAKDL